MSPSFLTLHYKSHSVFQDFPARCSCLSIEKGNRWTIWVGLCDKVEGDSRLARIGGREMSSGSRGAHGNTGGRNLEA